MQDAAGDQAAARGGGRHRALEQDNICSKELGPVEGESLALLGLEHSLYGGWSTGAGGVDPRPAAHRCERRAPVAMGCIATLQTRRGGGVRFGGRRDIRVLLTIGGEVYGAGQLSAAHALVPARALAALLC